MPVAFSCSEGTNTGEGIVGMNESPHWNLRALTWIANEAETMY